MGAWLARANAVTDEMVMAAAEALADCTTDDELSMGMVYPNMHRIRCVQGLE